MKYLFLTFAAIAVSLLIGFAAAGIIRKISRKRWGKGKLALSAAGIGLCVLFGVSAGYLSVHAPAQPAAVSALETRTPVSVIEIPEGYFLDGPGTETAVVFFPGGKVDTEAYAPLLRRIAAGGDDCFLLKMPFRLAVFGVNAPLSIMDSYDYSRWIVAGHSLGGSAAALFASANPDRVDGLVLLAAYPTKQIPSGVRLLSVYGSKDGCLERDNYARGREFWPESASEIVIEGGNHAGFGCYGPQKGDGEAMIPAAAQQSQTADAILSAF